MSPLLDSFDPFATHPFTNGSGLVPQPHKPSQYPIPIPSPRRPTAFSPTHSQYYADSSSHSSSSPTSSMSSNSPSSPVYAPQPLRRPMSISPSRSPSSPTEPIFVPFRKDTSSPELVLRKKTPKTKSTSTQTSSASPTSRKQ